MGYKKNIIYRYLFALAAFFMSAGLSSCAKEDADGDYKFGLMTDLGVVSYVADNGYFEIMRDYINKADEAVLIVYRNEHPDRTVTLGERVFITYSIDREVNRSESLTATDGKVYRINLTDFNSLLSKPVLRESDLEADEKLKDEVGYDRISVNRAWIFDKWLNIEFSYLRYDTEVYHIVNLVWDDTAGKEEGILHLFMRHNAMGETPGDIRTIERSGMASFPIDDIVTGSATLEIHCEYYDTSGNPKEWVTPVNYIAPDSKPEQTKINPGGDKEYYLGPPVNTITFVR